ncbi:MAG TPA: RluA family pseudouridine synthase [Methylomirabilota bacterium]|nr:RluA family pseudouridine synthase [Methylomirabilota bacterium]
MAKPNFIELPSGEQIPILFEDRSVLAIDKPAGWMLAPSDWTRTRRNLQLALETSIRYNDFWAKSRNLKYLRYIHRLDAETTGLILFAKSPGALSAFSELFEDHLIEKTYLAVVSGSPKRDQWACTMKLSQELDDNGRIRVDHAMGREAETEFIVLARQPDRALVEALPRTGRTHQIRVHAAATHHPIVGDQLYNPYSGAEEPLALRATMLRYKDPFTRKPVRIFADRTAFANTYGFPDVFAKKPAATPPPAPADPNEG